jgi:type II secretory pathway component PulF
MQLFLQQGLNPVEASIQVARSFSSSSQRHAARIVAIRLQSGMSLGMALAQQPDSDSLCRPSLRMLDERGGGLADALAATSKLLRRMAEERCRALAGVMPVVVLLVGATIVWGMLSSYFVALYPLIRMLTML